MAVEMIEFKSIRIPEKEQIHWQDRDAFAFVIAAGAAVHRDTHRPSSLCQRQPKAGYYVDPALTGRLKGM